MVTWKYKCMRCGRIYRTEEDRSAKTHEKTLMGLCPEHEKTTSKAISVRKTKSCNK
jgi:DNA-directed RNA polymerase subunit RPC12/RpoP